MRALGCFAASRATRCRLVASLFRRRLDDGSRSKCPRSLSCRFCVKPPPLPRWLGRRSVPQRLKRGQPPLSLNRSSQGVGTAPTLGEGLRRSSGLSTSASHACRALANSRYNLLSLSLGQFREVLKALGALGRVPNRGGHEPSPAQTCGRCLPGRYPDVRGVEPVRITQPRSRCESPPQARWFLFTRAEAARLLAASLFLMCSGAGAAAGCRCRRLRCRPATVFLPPPPAPP